MNLYQEKGELQLEGGFKLESGDLILQRQFAGDTHQYEAAWSSSTMVILNLEDDIPLIEEGIARQIVNRIQKARKKATLEPTQPIEVFYRISQREIEKDKDNEGENEKEGKKRKGQAWKSKKERGKDGENEKEEEKPKEKEKEKEEEFQQPLENVMKSQRNFIENLIGNSVLPVECKLKEVQILIHETFEIGNQNMDIWICRLNIGLNDEAIRQKLSNILSDDLLQAIRLSLLTKDYFVLKNSLELENRVEFILNGFKIELRLGKEIFLSTANLFDSLRTSSNN